jgi:PKD repeat protein
MALVAAAPLVAGGIHDITKGAKGPNASAMSWDYIAPDYGQWNANISNNNLRWMVIEVADNSTGVPVSISREHIRFAAQNAYPTGNATSMPVQMAAGRPYVITAIPNGPKGASAVVEDVFTVELPPVAEFTATMNWMDVSVDASASYDPDGMIMSWDWNWGDGMSGAGEMATHTYLMAGWYEITLTVTDNDGMTDTASAMVEAKEMPPELNAAFTATMNWMVVSVDASASTGLAPLSYAWDFGDGATDMGVTATHTYLAEGMYTITLTVTDGASATDTATAMVEAKMEPPPMPPVAAFTASIVYLDLSVDASASYDPDGVIVAWDWDFGDGMTGSGEMTTHSYATAGIKLVTLTVTDAQGLKDTETAEVTATEPPKPPVASFIWSADYLVAAFDGSASTDPDSMIVAWDWDFGDGMVGSGETVSHTYAMAGTYTVVLKVTDSQTLWDEESKSVTVTANPPPVAAFTWSLSGQTLSVDAAGSSDDRAVVSWEWDWGDGTKGTGMTATHTYTKPVTSTHLILAAPGALAPVPPYTLIGFTYGPDGMTPMGNCIVTVTNTRTGDVINAVSDPDYGLIYDPNTGSYVDLANTPSGLLDGDVISVTATNGVYSGTNTGVAHPLTGAQMTIDVVLTGGIPPVFVDYTVTLTVKDAYGLSSSTSVTITVEFPGA